MKKLFRFKYEPCNGTCYAPEDVFFAQMKLLSSEDQLRLISLIVQAHDNLCDNPDYSFGLDLDESTGIFIGHFRTPDRTDIYTGKTLAKCLEALCPAVAAEKISLVSGSCNYGESGYEDLAQKIRDQVAA